MKNKFVIDLNNILKKYGTSAEIVKNDLFINTNTEHLENIMYFLRDHESCLFKMLIDILVVDYPESKQRFSLIYCLLSLKYNIRVSVKVQIDELTSVPSITNIYKSACWMEREVWDMNGIFFDNHPDLRRILTDYGFEGYPLRKDFPLSGFVEASYDYTRKRVVNDRVELSQEYRAFKFTSPWETLELN